MHGCGRQSSTFLGKAFMGHEHDNCCRGTPNRRAVNVQWKFGSIWASLSVGISFSFFTDKLFDPSLAFCQISSASCSSLAKFARNSIP